MNQYNGVVFPFLNLENVLQKSNYINKESTGSFEKSSFNYIVTDKNQTIHVEYSKMSTAVLNLGLSRTTLLRYLNFDKYIYSKKLDLYIKIKNVGKEINSDKSTRSHKYYSLISDIDITNLPAGIIAMSSDKKTILRKFNTIKEAALLLDNKKDERYIRRYVNRDKLVKAGNFFCYFLKNPLNIIRHKANKKSVVLFDIINKSIIYFHTLKSMNLYIGINNVGSSIKIKKYLINDSKGKYYKKRYKFLYFKGIDNNFLYQPIKDLMNLDSLNKSNNELNDNQSNTESNYKQKEFKPILVYNKSSNQYLVFQNITDFNIKFNIPINIALDKYLYPSNKYYNNFQFIYLVDFYCNYTYDDSEDINIKL